jgi:hypothetical protein
MTKDKKPSTKPPLRVCFDVPRVRNLRIYRQERLEKQEKASLPFSEKKRAYNRLKLAISLADNETQLIHYLSQLF